MLTSLVSAQHSCVEYEVHTESTGASCDTLSGESHFRRTVSCVSVTVLKKYTHRILAASRPRITRLLNMLRVHCMYTYMMND